MLATDAYQMQINLLPELLSLIPDILGVEYLTQLDNFGPTIIEHRALANAALVCKDWYFKASRYLNGYLKLASFSDVSEALQDVPKQTHIHTLSICPGIRWNIVEASVEEPMQRLLKALQNLQRLEIRGAWFNWPSVSQFPLGGEHIKELLSSGRLSHLTLASCHVPSEVFTSLAPSITSLAIEDVGLNTVEFDRLLLPPQLHALKLENSSHAIAAPDLLQPYKDGEKPSWFSTLETLVLPSLASSPQEGTGSHSIDIGRLAVRNLLDAPKLKKVAFTRSKEMSLFFNSVEPETVNSDSKIPLEPPLTMDTLHKFEAISVAMWSKQYRDPFFPLAQFLETKSEPSNLKELRLDFTSSEGESAVVLYTRRDMFEANWKPLDAILCKKAYGSLRRLVIDVSCKRPGKGALVPHEWFRCEAFPALASRGVTIDVIGDFIRYNGPNFDFTFAAYAHMGLSLTSR
ncbi:hypothetical protein BKA70DRAFT_1573406 [Coprinopsis sp. MPI-PUGE-AT-0042]|nr:hypothetical protein BKA70DRAFT_1573406 [Coprinopsis sp. MPI-PUGE-AT-0042]